MPPPPSSSSQHQLHESTKRKSTFDLKNQLSDLQNKLLDNQQGKTTKQRTSLNEIEPDSDNSTLPRLPNVFGKRSKESGSKRNSLPAMPLTAAGSQHGKPGNDVNFVVGLSENLLLECRRLTAENSQYKLHLKETQDDLERVTKQLTNVSAINKKFIDQEESIKDKNWELEGTLQELKEKYDKLNNENVKLNQSKTEIDNLNEQLKNEIELQKLINVNLADELSSTKQQWTTEIKNYKSINEELNNENDNLHKSVSELKEENENLKTSAKRLTTTIPLLTDSEFFNKNDSDSDNEFSVIENPSPVKGAASRNIELEKETIQSNLAHSNKTITKLRSTILKLRSEKEDLEKKFAASQVSGNISATFNSPVNKNKRIKALKSQPSLLSNSNRSSKALSFYENDTTTNENWEDFSFNNSPEHVLSKNVVANNSSSEDEEAGESTHVSRKLLSQELESNPTDIVNKYIEENDLVLVGQTEFNRLKEQDSKLISYESQNSSIIKAAEQYNVLALPRSDGTHHLQIPVQVLKQKCEEENLVLLNRDDYEELLEAVNSEPTETELIERASKLNRVVLPIEEHEKLTQIYEQPSLDFLTEKLKNNYHQIPIEESVYETMKNPSLDHVKELASSNKHVLLPIDHHNTLVEKANYEPTEEELIERVTSQNKVVLPDHEHKELIQFKESPSLNFLTDRLRAHHQQVLLHESEYQSLKSPSLEQIKKLASAQKHSILPIEEHVRLVKNDKSPTLEFLKDKLMTNYHQVLVDETEYEKLKNPSLDELKDLASVNKHTVIPVEHHETLVQKSTKPSIDELKSFAETHGHSTVPKEELHKLQEQVTNPSSSQIYQYATSAGMVLLNKDEHARLSFNTKSPTLQFLTSKLGELDHVVVPADDYASLKDSAEESIHSKAERENAIVVPKDKYTSLEKEKADLHNKLNNPDVEYLKDRAKSQGHSLVESQLYQDLIKSHELPLTKKAEKAGKVLVDTSEYEALVNTSNRPSLDFISTKANDAGMALIEKSELESLKDSHSLIENTPDEFLVSKAAASGKEVLAKDELELLKHLETKEGVELQAAKYDLSVIDRSKLTELVALESRLSNMTTDDLVEFAEKLDYSTIEKTELQKLKQKAEKPTIADIKAHEKQLNVVVVPSDEFEHLHSSAHSPTIDHIKEKAGNVGHTIVPESEFKDIHEKAHSPTLEHLASKSELHGHAIVPKEELEILHKKAHNPDVEHLKEKAVTTGFHLLPKSEYTQLRKSFDQSLDEKAAEVDSVVVPKDEFTKLQTLSTDPSPSFLKEKAEKLGYYLVPQEESHNLNKLVESPTPEYIQKKAASLGLVAVPNSEFELLTRRATQPTADEIQEHALKNKLVTMSVSEHKLIVNPPHEHIVAKALEVGYSVVPNDELDSMKEQIVSPSLSYIQEKSAILGHKVISNDVHSQLESAIASPDLSYLQEKASLHHHRVVSNEEFENLNKLLSEPLKEKAEKEGAVVLDSEEHEKLVQLANEPLSERANKLGHIAIPVSEYLSLIDENKSLSSQLEAPSQEYLELKAEALGLALLGNEEYELLLEARSESLEDKAQRDGKIVLPIDDHKKITESLKSPELHYLIEKAHAMSYTVLPSDEVNSLRRQLSEPTHEELTNHVKSRGSVILDQAKHDDLITKITLPSLDFLKENASIHNHVVVPEESYKSLVASSSESLSDKAEKEGSIIIPKSNFKRLSTLEEAPSLEFLKSKAQLLDHEIVHKEALSELRSLSEEPLLSKANKEGKILLSGEEYTDLQSKKEELENEIRSFKEKEKNPDEAILIERASTLGLVVLKDSDYKVLSQAAASPSLDQLIGHATKKDHILLPKWKYEILERKATNPNEDEIRSFATGLGKRVIEADEFERLTLEASKPSREALNKAADELGFILIGKKEYDLLKEQYKHRPPPIEILDPSSLPETPIMSPTPGSPSVGTPKSKVMSSKEQYEDMIRQENEKKIQKQKVAAAKALGIVSLSTDEYKRLLAKQQINEPTISDIYNGAKTFGLTVLPHNDYKSLLKRQNAVENRDDLENAAKLLRFSIMPLNLSHNQSTTSLTDDEDFHDAVSHQSSKISLSSSDAYEDALSRQETSSSSHFDHFDDALSLDDLRERASDFGYSLVPMTEPLGSEDDTTSVEDNDADDEELTVHSVKEIEQTVSVSDYNALQQELAEKSSRLSELENKKVTEFEIIQMAPEFGLVAISKDDYESFTRDLSDDEIKDILTARGYVMVAKQVYDQLLEDVQHSKNASTPSGFSAIATSLGLSVLPKRELDTLKKDSSRELTHDDVSQLASGMGMVLISKDEYEELKSRSSEISQDKLQAYLDNEGLLTLSKSRHDELELILLKASETPDQEQLKLLVAQSGMTMLSSDEYDDLQNHKVTELDITESAPDFGLAVIPQSQLLELQKSPEITEEELSKRANELGFSLIDIKELDTLKNRDISANDLAMKAAQLDLVLISLQAYEDLKASNVEGDGLEAAARKLGLLCIPETSYIATTVAPTPDVHNVVVLPKTYYNKLARSHTLSIERISKEDLIEHCKKRGIILAGDENFDMPDKQDSSSIQFRAQHSPQSSYHSPVLNTFKSTTPLQNTPPSNIVSSPSLFSIATNVSLTDRKMIPALTQTIIGEYLYKYYRRLGPFSSISENRHERYFWIHPYSLTLYWSATNPVLGDPSTNKIRAAAILKVEVVEDNNPLPPGLFHKSIIVHSSERNVKITCPTRQRHNVWYNSLRYLLERTTEGLEFGDRVDTNYGFNSSSNATSTPTIEEEADGQEEAKDIDTYRYLKPRASMMKQQRALSNPTKKSSRIFSTGPGIQRSSTSSSLSRKK